MAAAAICILRRPRASLYNLPKISRIHEMRKVYNMPFEYYDILWNTQFT